MTDIEKELHEIKQILTAIYSILALRADISINTEFEFKQAVQKLTMGDKKAIESYFKKHKKAPGDKK